MSRDDLEARKAVAPCRDMPAVRSPGRYTAAFRAVHSAAPQKDCFAPAAADNPVPDTLVPDTSVPGTPVLAAPDSLDSPAAHVPDPADKAVHSGSAPGKADTAAGAPDTAAGAPDTAAGAPDTPAVHDSDTAVVVVALDTRAETVDECTGVAGSAAEAQSAAPGANRCFCSQGAAPSGASQADTPGQPPSRSSQTGA